MDYVNGIEGLLIAANQPSELIMLNVPMSEKHGWATLERILPTHIQNAQVVRAEFDSVAPLFL